MPNEKRLHCSDCCAFGSLLSSQFVNTDGAHNRHRHIISANICEASRRLLTKSYNLCGKIRSKTISEKFSLAKKKPKRFLHIQTRWFIDGFSWNFGIFEESSDARLSYEGVSVTLGEKLLQLFVVSLLNWKVVKMIFSFSFFQSHEYWQHNHGACAIRALDELRFEYISRW